MTEFIPLADDTRSQADRPHIDAFLLRVLPDSERELVESYFISDEATILDCSMAEPEVLIENCEKAYGVKLTIETLRLPLWVLWSYVVAMG